MLVVFFIQCRRYFFSLSLFYYFIYITIIIRNSCCILLFFSGNRSSWISAKRGDRFRLGLCLRLTTTAAASATNSRPPNPALIPHPLSLSLSFLPSSFYTHSPFPTNDSFYHSRLIQLSTTHFIFCFFFHPFFDIWSSVPCYFVGKATFSILIPGSTFQSPSRELTFELYKPLLYGNTWRILDIQLWRPSWSTFETWAVGVFPLLSPANTNRQFDSSSRHHGRRRSSPRETGAYSP